MWNAVYGDYQVLNPSTKNAYRVAIRSKEPRLNFCICLDFKNQQLRNL